MKLEVHITRNDIEVGKRKDCELCPVAIAISRASNKEAWVSGNCLLFMENDGLSDAILLPGPVRRFVDQFDKGKPVDPLFFTIEIPV